MRLYLFATVATLLIDYSSAYAQAGVVPTRRDFVINGGTATITENFDTLVATSTSNSVPSGFGFTETGTNADGNYTAATGSATTGDTYSYSSLGSTERALGMLQSGTLVSTITAAFTNNTGATLTSFTVTYVGERWRIGAPNRTDRLDFGFATTEATTALSAGSFTAGFTEVDALDYVTVAGSAIASTNGNTAANRATVSATFSTTLAAGDTLLIRFSDFNASGADDGLAVDDFSISSTFQPVPAPPAVVSLAIGGLVGLLSTGTHTVVSRRAKRK